MAQSKTSSYYVIKAVRISGWILLPVLVAFILTGYVGAGKLDLGRALPDQEAITLHARLAKLLIVVAAIHSAGAIWLAMRRWGWIRGRPKT